MLILLLIACDGDIRVKGLPGFGGDDTGVTDTSDPGDDTGESPQDELTGWIGSPCDTDADCPYEDGYCALETEGFPNGMCSQLCEEFCPDEDGYPVTFCASDDEVFELDLDDGTCVSRCDYGAYSDGGCREGYGCVLTERANDPGTRIPTCLPGRESETSTCLEELASRGIAFEATYVEPTSPDGHDDLLCIVEDPVYLESPVAGVDLYYYDGTYDERFFMSCEGALALVDTLEDVTPDGVTGLYHIGTYNCRVISGTSTLSRHSFADAIDIYGFEFDNGDLWTLVDHWEHETTNFSTAAGEWLYDSAYRWHDNKYWNIILTPNYNSAHDNHYHVDLTPGSDYVGMVDMDEYWIGPAPYSD